jgi:fumarate reductase iron-sulfur subunit
MSTPQAKPATFRLEVTRYDPSTDAEPYIQGYDVPYEEDWVVLDALTWVKDNLDSTLTFRWSCHMAVCGSCGMQVNDSPVLACKAFLRDYVPGVVRVDPLRNFPIERDLVIGLEGFMDRLEAIKPYIIRDEEKPLDEGAHVQLPRQLMRFKHHTQCINCLLCYSACPQMGLNPDFLGPAALALAHRYNLDSRDQGRRERQKVTGSAEGVWECTFVSACSDVCPKDVEPAGAIQEQKVQVGMDWFLDHLIPGRKAP